MLHVVVCVEGGRGVEVDGASLTAGIEKGLAETLLLFFSSWCASTADDINDLSLSQIWKTAKVKTEITNTKPESKWDPRRRVRWTRNSRSTCSAFLERMALAHVALPWE